MTDRRLCEDVFRSSSEKVTVHSSEIFDDGVLLGFIAPRTFEANQTQPGEPQLSITISREEMDELCNYWQSQKKGSKGPKSFTTKLIVDGEDCILVLPDEWMEEAGFAIGDTFEVSAREGAIFFQKLEDTGESS